MRKLGKFRIRKPNICAFLMQVAFLCLDYDVKTLKTRVKYDVILHGELTFYLLYHFIYWWLTQLVGWNWKQVGIWVSSIFSNFGHWIWIMDGWLNGDNSHGRHIITKTALLLLGEQIFSQIFDAFKCKQHFIVPLLWMGRGGLIIGFSLNEWRTGACSGVACKLR